MSGPKHRPRGETGIPGRWMGIKSVNPHIRKNKQTWARFAATAGIDRRITFTSALQRTKLHRVVLSRYIHGHVGIRLDTALYLADALGITVDAFARALRESCEISARQEATRQAINAAIVEGAENP